MNTGFDNVYEDERRAAAYAKLEFPGTYSLAFRDLPAIIGEHVAGRTAVDFGCGTGRSTRFLRDLGFEVVGVDLSEQMLAKARETDPQGEYRLAQGNAPIPVSARAVDLVLSAFTFDNIPTEEAKVATLRDLTRLLKDGGRMLNLVSSPEIYVNEWASFTTQNHPENKAARSGDKVHIVMLDVEDSRPVEDILWTDQDYRDVYGQAGLVVIETYRPLATASDPFPWVSETTIAPWVIYVVESAR